jgi:hypothetical protein
MAEKKGWRTLCVRITEEAHDRLTEEAKRSHTTVTALVLEMLEARYGLEETPIPPAHRPRKKKSA